MLRAYKLAKVVKVYDADTITVLYRKKQYVLRICNIDAPEMHQYYGDIAQSKLSDLILGKKVYFETLSRDKYGRYVSKVKYNNRLLDRWLVKEGLSWVYPLYCKDKQLYKLEKTARENKKGLWATESPEPPWEYRKKKRSE